jgi:hypothetical protein
VPPESSRHSYGIHTRKAFQLLDLFKNCALFFGWEIEKNINDRLWPNDLSHYFFRLAAFSRPFTWA